MESLIFSCSSLQMPLTAAVYFIVLNTCSTEECRLQLGEKTKERSVTLGGIDIRMCHVNCVGDAFILAWCLQLHGDSKQTKIPGRTRPANHNDVLKPPCGSKICSGDLLEKGCSKECVQTSTSDASEDLTLSKTVPPALVTTQESDPHATPSQADRDLYHASRRGNLERVKQILATGQVDINTRGRYSRTPVMEAVRTGHSNVVTFLVGRGADVSLVDMFGYSTLHYACIHGDLDTVKLILSLDVVDVNARDSDGKTAADYARRYRHQHMLDLLLSRGAH